MSCATAVMYTPYSPSYNAASSAAPTSSPSIIPQGLFHSGSPPEKLLLPHSSELLEDNNNSRSHLDEKLLHHHHHHQSHHLHHATQVFKITDSGPHSPSNTKNNIIHTSVTQPMNSSSCSPPPTSSSSRPPSIYHEEDSCDSSISAHRLSSNIIVFTHYVGDASSVVEDHFSRALNYEREDHPPCKPMSARNLPASFWTAPSETSTHHHHLSSSPPPRSSSMGSHHLPPPPPQSGALLPPPHSGASYSDLYPESITGALHQLAADWQYSSSSSSSSCMGQQPPHHHHPSYSNYSNYASRFGASSNYWAPRLMGSSSSTSSVKSEWSPEPPYSDYGPVSQLGPPSHHTHNHPPSHHNHVPYHYSNIPGLVDASSPSGVESSSSLNKSTAPNAATDLFWTTSF